VPTSIIVVERKKEKFFLIQTDKVFYVNDPIPMRCPELNAFAERCVLGFLQAMKIQANLVGKRA